MREMKYRYKPPSKSSKVWIVVVLLVIAVVGIGMFISNSSQKSVLTEQKGGATGESGKKGTEKIKIEQISTLEAIVSVRNIGDGDADVSRMNAYVNNIQTTCVFTVESISPGKTATCKLLGGCTSGFTLRMTAQNSEDQTMC